MKSYVTPAAGAAAWAMAFVCVLATGQTRIDMYSQAKNIDFSRATSTRPFPVGSALPSVCAAGETYFKSDAPAGRNLYLCTGTNVWTPVETTTIDVGADNTYTGHNDFSGAQSLSVRVLPSKPAADCDSASDVGRVVLRKSDPSAESGILYLCQSTAAGTAEWKASTYAYGAAPPLNCDAGELYFDIDAPAGQQWLGCVAANTWMPLAGASVPAGTGAAGKLLGTDGSAPSWRSLKGFMDVGTGLIPDGNILGELGGNNTWSGHQFYPASSTQTIVSPASKIVCNAHTVAISSAIPVTLSSIATVENGANGQVCVIVNAGVSSVILQDEERLPSSNLQLAAPTIEIAPKTSLRLMFNSTIGDWIQEGVNPQPSAVRGPKCGTGATGTNGAVSAEALASYTFQAGELAPGDHLRLTAFWQHMPGPDGTLDTAFRTQLKFGSVSLEETVAPANADPSLFSEYWIFITGTSSETAVQRHFRPANGSFLNTAAAGSLTVPAANATVALQARASNAAGSDDAVALTAYCIELVKGR
jgi:hypothetical protein